MVERTSVLRYDGHWNPQVCHSQPPASSISNDVVSKRVGLKVTSMKWSDTDRRNEDISNAQIPDEMQYTDVVRRDLDVGFDDADAVPDLIQTSQGRLDQDTGHKEHLLI